MAEHVGQTRAEVDRPVRQRPIPKPVIGAFEGKREPLAVGVELGIGEAERLGRRFDLLLLLLIRTAHELLVHRMPVDVGLELGVLLGQIDRSGETASRRRSGRPEQRAGCRGDRRRHQFDRSLQAAHGFVVQNELDHMGQAAGQEEGDHQDSKRACHDISPAQEKADDPKRNGEIGECCPAVAKDVHRDDAVHDEVSRLSIVTTCLFDPRPGENPWQTLCENRISDCLKRR